MLLFLPCVEFDFFWGGGGVAWFFFWRLSSPFGRGKREPSFLNQLPFCAVGDE